MNKFKFLIVLFFMTASAVSVNATLINNGDGTITDTDTNLMWLQDANYALTSGYSEADAFGYMTWDDALYWAEDILVYAGYDDWSLPVADPVCGVSDNCDESGMGHLYYDHGITSAPENQDPFINVEGGAYWTGTEYDDNTNYAWYFRFGNGWQQNKPKSGTGRAWAVRVVPEPISSTLFIIGGATLGFRRLSRRENG